MIRDYREQAGLTQEAVAKALGVSTVTIWRWEHGQRTPKRSRWPALREAIGIPLEELMKLGLTQPQP